MDFYPKFTYFREKAMDKLLFSILIFLTAMAACKETPVIPAPPPGEQEEHSLYCGGGFCAHGELVKDGKIYEKDSRGWLWAGTDSSWHFDITNWIIDSRGLNDYGYTRETIEALISPQYVPAHDALDAYKEVDRVMVLHDGDSTKLYPFPILQYHEVINEMVGDEPVMVTFCYLADYAAVLKRSYCDETFTFALSGYTYAEEGVFEGRQGFVLWDRETKSLWWPLSDVAISGPMLGNSLRKYDRRLWQVSTWAEALKDYPEAYVIAPSHDWTPPTDWPALRCEDLDCCNE